MTKIYFVRHAEPDKTVMDDRNRPLTAQGLEDTQFVYDILKNKGIDVAISSPHKRSIDSIKRLADALEISIQTDERFRERKAGAKGQGLRSHPERWKAMSARYVKKIWFSERANMGNFMAVPDIQNVHIRGGRISDSVWM